ncbi:hypothetical protein BFP70_07195 [Thioclava sp. SK-1]|nr:hypothetical protein BFP70_07195 [Thioclava sp. SK-1]
MDNSIVEFGCRDRVDWAFSGPAVLRSGGFIAVNRGAIRAAFVRFLGLNIFLTINHNATQTEDSQAWPKM